MIKNDGFYSRGAGTQVIVKSLCLLLKKAWQYYEDITFSVFPSSYHPPLRGEEAKAKVPGLLPLTLVHHVRHSCRHLPGSANRWKTFIICLVFPPCPSSFQYNFAELDESAAGLPRASASLPELKGASSHFRGLHQCHSIYVASRFQTPQWSCAPRIPRQRRIWKLLQKNRWVFTHNCGPRQHSKWCLFTLD